MAGPCNSYTQSQQTKGGGAAGSSSSAKNAAADRPSGSDILPEAVKRLQAIEEGRILALDQAVHFSIDCACELIICCP